MMWHRRGSVQATGKSRVFSVSRPSRVADQALVSRIGAVDRYPLLMS
jgi:hypothetical protein